MRDVATYRPGWRYVNVVPSRRAPVKSVRPSPSASRSTRTGCSLSTRENATVVGARPRDGVARRTTGPMEAATTTREMAWLAVAPVAVTAVATTLVSSVETGTSTTKIPPWTGATTPLTVTPTSAPPAPT